MGNNALLLIKLAWLNGIGTKGVRHLIWRGCAYDREFLDDLVRVKRSILSNPFEKFERKGFVYYFKDLNILSFHPALWEKERGFLERYYERLGGSVRGRKRQMKFLYM